MADAALTSVINKIVEIGASLILETSARLRQLSENIKWIERQMRHFNSCLKDAEAKELRSHEVANLINEMRDLAFDIEDLLDTYLPKIESHKRKGQFKRVAANAFALEIEKIQKRAKEIEDKREKCGVVANMNQGNAEDDTWDERRRFLIGTEPIIVGRDEIVENLKQEVLRESSKCEKICVVGEGGVGKTTVVKKLYKEVKDEFACKAIVCVSQEPKIRDLLVEIGQQVGLGKEKIEENLEANLRSLLEHNMYIIVLDDIWDTKPWDDLKNIIPTNSENGSRIIITSRYTDVGRYIGGESSLERLEALSEEESWELFVSLLVENDGERFHNDDELMKHIGREIVEKCAGLPLAISAAAGMLRKRKRCDVAWREVLEIMSSSTSTGGENDWLNVLSLSYKDLPMDLRPLFLYLGFFPEDEEIYTNDLVVAWDVEKLMIPIEGTQIPQHVVAAKLEMLYERNLIQVVDRDPSERIFSCRIHDVLRSLCIRIAEKNNFFFSTFQSIDTTNLASTLRRLTLESSSITRYFSSNFRAPKLRSLLCFSHYYLDDDGFLHLPEQIGNLSSLTYLKLVGYFDSIPSSLRNLKKLITFDARRAYCRRMHPIQASVFSEMRCLKHLLLGKFTKLVWPKPMPMMGVIINHCSTGINHKVFFPNLESLSAVDCNDIDATVLRKLSKLRNLKLRGIQREHLEIISTTPPIFEKLQQLELTDISVQFDGLNMSGYHHHFNLTLSGKKMVLIHHFEFPPNLIELSLEHVEIDDDVTKGLKGLPKLEILTLFDCIFQNPELDWSGENSFPHLQVLRIHHCEFEELIMDDQGMPNIRKFDYMPDILGHSPLPIDVHHRLSSVLLYE